MKYLNEAASTDFISQWNGVNLFARCTAISSANREETIEIQGPLATRAAEAVLVEAFTIERDELSTQWLETTCASWASLVCARLAKGSALVLNEGPSQLTAALITSEAIRVPVLSVRREHCLGDDIVAAVASVSINAVRVERAPLLDDVLIGDSAVALRAWHQVSNAVRAMRSATVIVKRSPELHATSPAVKMIGMPALAQGSQMFTKDSFTTFRATVRRNITRNTLRNVDAFSLEFAHVSCAFLVDVRLHRQRLVCGLMRRLRGLVR